MVPPDKHAIEKQFFLKLSLVINSKKNLHYIRMPMLMAPLEANNSKIYPKLLQLF